ncbi:MAG: hypothetical protein H7A00_09345 [Hahellaceae bacterium]|nr:hypothetical protein [Hahellaceae bacterium]
MEILLVLLLGIPLGLFWAKLRKQQPYRKDPRHTAQIEDYALRLMEGDHFQAELLREQPFQRLLLARLYRTDHAFVLSLAIKTTTPDDPLSAERDGEIEKTFADLTALVEYMAHSTPFRLSDFSKNDSSDDRDVFNPSGQSAP